MSTPILKEDIYNASIVIPTYNGKEKVIQLLLELSKQTIKTFETIVIIDGSTDGTAQTLNSMSFGLLSLQIIEQANAGRAGSRNAGAMHASSEILLFIDDDMMPAENLVEEHIKAQAKHPIVVGILDSYDDGNNQELLEFAYYMNKQMNTEIFQQSELPREVPYITANNFSIRKSLFENLGGFDDRLNDAEDFELAIRCKDNSHPIFYSANCLAYHRLPPTLTAAVKRLKEYRLGRSELLKYHPEAAEYLMSAKNKIAVYKRPFFYFFSAKLWLKLADGNFFKILPKPIRFKLYDILQTANFHY